MLQKGADSTDLFFGEQLLTGMMGSTSLVGSTIEKWLSQLCNKMKAALLSWFCGVMLQKGAYSKDLFFVEQLLTGLVAANAIKDIQALSQASGMFKTVHRHLLRAGTLAPDVKPSLHMSSLVGLEPLQVIFCLFCLYASKTTYVV